MLTDEQEAFVEVCRNMTGCERLVLNAPGGTGKTYTVKKLYDILARDAAACCRPPPLVLTPTHKVRMLYFKSGVVAQTIHRFFKAEADVDELSGEMSFTLKQNTDPRMMAGIIIVDECSMVNEDMFNHFQLLEIPVVFIGDRHQIMPVKEGVSPVFSVERKMSFTKNMRIKVNPDSMSAMYLKQFRDAVDDKSVRIRVIRQPVEMMLDYMKRGGDWVVLAWTNKQVNYWSDFIRRYIFADVVRETGSLCQYYPGERLVFTGYRCCGFETYYSSDVITIKSVKVESQYVPFKRCSCNGVDNAHKQPVIACLQCGIRGHRFGGYEIDFYTLEDERGVTWLQPMESCRAKMMTIINDFKNHCRVKKDKELWREYYCFMGDYCADLKCCYSMTVHKAQGSQFSTVFVDINNIRMNRDPEECSRLSYTAVSRFTDYVYFI